MKCPFFMKVRATTDGESLLITHFNEVNNHNTSEAEFKGKEKWGQRLKMRLPTSSL